MDKVLIFEEAKTIIVIADFISWKESKVLINPSNKRLQLHLYTKGLRNIKEILSVFFHELGHVWLWKHLYRFSLASQFNPYLKFLNEFLAWTIGRYFASLFKIQLSDWMINKTLREYAKVLPRRNPQ